MVPAGCLCLVAIADTQKGRQINITKEEIIAEFWSLNPDDVTATHGCNLKRPNLLHSLGGRDGIILLCQSAQPYLIMVVCQLTHMEDGSLCSPPTEFSYPKT